MKTEPAPGKKRTLVRRAVRWLGIVVVLVAVALAVWLRSALYNRFVRFPREEAAWAAIRSERKRVAEITGWREYRGILHSHSELSHDSEVPFAEILRVMKAIKIDFICLSDHCAEGRADFNLQWRGIHDGKLFVPGFEMKEGIMPFGVASGVVLSNRTDSDDLARQITAGGGVLFYAHPEEPRVWDRPELTGMEIYNIHADFKAVAKRPSLLLPDLLVNQRRFPEQVFHSMFRRPEAVLRRWDDLNRTRHITGIAGNDCHQNTGLRGFITATNTFRIEDTSPRTIAEYKLNWFTHFVARVCFGPLAPNRRLFHFQLDPYERMARFVNTHVLARQLTEPALMESLRAGRAFIGFDMIADSAGFLWLAESGKGRAVMGETLAFSARTRLRAVSPRSCRFTVVKDGTVAYQQEGRTLEWTPPGPGKYRVEAELKVLDEWVPWVYANPIELK